MNFIVSLILRLPFWVHLILAAGLFYLGLQMKADMDAKLVAKAALVEQAQPALLPIAEFRHAGRPGYPEEAHLLVQFALEYNLHLSRKRNGITTSESNVYVLMDPDAPAGTMIARGAVSIDPDDKDAFINWILSRLDAEGQEGAIGPVVSLPGLVIQPSDAGQARTQLAKAGLTLAPDFMFIEPFFAGREAGLAVTQQDRLMTFAPLSMVLLFLIPGMTGLMRWRRARKARALGDMPVAQGPVAASVPVAAQEAHLPDAEAAMLAKVNAAMAAPSTPQAAPTNDFIGALAARRTTPATLQAPLFEKAMPTAAPVGVLGQMMRFYRYGTIAIVLFAMLGIGLPIMQHGLVTPLTPAPQALVQSLMANPAGALGAAGDEAAPDAMIAPDAAPVAVPVSGPKAAKKDAASGDRPAFAERKDNRVVRKAPVAAPAAPTAAAEVPLSASPDAPVAAAQDVTAAGPTLSADGKTLTLGDGDDNVVAAETVSSYSSRTMALVAVAGQFAADEMGRTFAQLVAGIAGKERLIALVGGALLVVALLARLLSRSRNSASVMRRRGAPDPFDRLSERRLAERAQQV